MPSAATKRPGGGDGAADDDHGGHHHLSNGVHTPNKLPRTDSIPFSSAASDYGVAPTKKKSAGSTRTGQACDRCKIRKIRCDARPGGCSPCLQNNTECRTTDRITGRATSRGHTEHIENENAQLKMYMVELQQQLREQGVEPKPPPSMGQGYAHMPYLSQAWDTQQNGASPTPSAHQSERQASSAALLSDFRAGCIGDNYLGVSSENTWLSPIEGTSLALFGTKVDLSEFMPPESDPAYAAMSYRTFLSHAFGRAQPFAPQLPSYEQCKVYAEWYFRSVQNFIPVLHKPDFMALLGRIYNEQYEPAAAEKVMVHMVLAVINFQFASRNQNEQARQDSMSHYHYALSFIPDLVTGHKLEDIQALTLICSQLRNQPRPGASWMFTNMVLGLAIECGLHRSANAWQGSAISSDPHQLEMRKRIFWSLLVFHVHVSGKLGRPMPLRMEDFDIEIPEPQPDSLPGEHTNSKWKRCSWRAGSQGFKLLRIMMQVYSSIYSIKSTGQYETNVRALEKELDKFNSSRPLELQGGPQTKEEDRVSSLYLDMCVAECQLLLHHPSLCRSSSPEITSRNLDLCLHWSSKLLSTAVQLKELKSLDTTWYYSTDFLAAVFTTLFASTERRDQLTSSDLQKLRQDMDQWLEVFGEVSLLLGAGPHLQSAVKGIIDFSITNISNHIATKTASAAVASTASPTEQDPPQNEQGFNTANGSEYYGTVQANDQHYADPTNHHQAQQVQNTYPAGDHSTYADPYHSGLSYSNGNVGAFGHAAYGAEEPKSTIEAQLVAHNAAIGQQPQQPAPTSFMAAFQSPGSQVTNGYQSSPPSAPINGQPAFPQSGPAAWRQFADTMMTNVSGHDFVNSAGALMAPSGGTTRPVDGSMNMATVGNIQLGTAEGTQTWPLLQYHDGPAQQHS